MIATQRDRAVINTAMVAAGAMIAFQVAGRATRDALFLSTFPVTSLPRMVATAAAVSLATMLVASRAMGRWGPRRLLPAMFIVSTLLLLAEFGLLKVAPRAAAVAVYLHFNALGALLVSGFWSLMNERLDPRTAKRAISRIGATATIGGVVGGLVAVRASGTLSVAAMLPILALVHAACTLLVLRIGGDGTAYGTVPATASSEGPLRTLAASPYLRTLVAVVFVATISEGLLDYVLKSSAKDAFGQGPQLLRFFAVFYASVNLLGAALQGAAGGRVLERLGLARTVGILPWTVAVGGAGAIVFPGLSTAIVAKGSEAVVRNSLYRSGYELLFTPLPPAEKRGVKALLDVGAVRVGDMLAAGLIQGVLLLPLVQAPALMLLLAVLAAAAGIVLSLRIHGGYVATLERNLLTRAVQLDIGDVEDSTTRLTLERTIAGLPAVAAAAAAPEDRPFTAAPADPELARLLALRSREAARVRQALRAGPLEAEHVPQAIALLAWDDVARAAVDALGDAATHHAGQLVDALLDPETDFAVRRRVPLALARARSQRVADGLLEGLLDQRFEVRYRCGRALARLHAEAPTLVVAPERVFAAVLREAEVDRRVWESHQLLEQEDDDPLDLGSALRERASRSLEHVFTVLSLVLPRRPLQIAFRGLHTVDPHLRGTSLEYLETALPPPVRERLWPFLDDSPARVRSQRTRDQIVSDLISAGDSIATDLATLRRRSGQT